MATTSIWDVKDNLKRVLDYTSNPNKTEALSDEDYHFNGLNQAIIYTTNDLKTEKQLYVSGINCSLSTALRDMNTTKKQFHKTDGILAYHAYQSFVPGEVTAETAHQIGIELAQKLWGDRFEVLVSTHLDKAHYHNHFVLNSVSFKDGLRYYDNKSSYQKMRKVSDDLCRKYKLHVIEEPQYKSQHYAAWQNEKSIRQYIREDVDYAISRSMTMKQFISTLERMGYKMKFNKHWAVLPPNGKRYIRLRSLSDDDSYTQEAIHQRILEISNVRFESIRPRNKPTPLRLKGNIKNTKKLTGFKALYFRYMYEMGILPKNAPNKKRVHFLLKEDLRYLDKITQEVTLLGKKKINTLEELESHLLEAEASKEILIKERRCIYNKIRRCTDEDRKILLKHEIETLSSQIKEKSKEVMLYESIKERSIQMADKLKQVKDEENRSSKNHRKDEKEKC